MPPGDLIGYAEAARLLYPDENLHTIVARVRRLAMAGTLRQYRNPIQNSDARGQWLVSRSEVEQLAAGGGTVPRSGGRPVKEPTSYDLRRLITAIEHQLKQTPPRPLQVGHARETLLALKAMRDQQDELWRLRTTERLYAGLARGLQRRVGRGRKDERRRSSSQMEARTMWVWERGERSGQAATAAEALVEALQGD
jgi:hypothetical protein